MAENATERDEARMIAAILAGDAQQFHELIRPYERSVYLMAFSLLRDESDAEDSAQDAFLKAYRNLAGFRAESKFSTWMISIVLNEARTRLRRKGADRFDSIDEPAEDGSAQPALLRDWREIPSEVLERQETRRLIEGAINDLPPIYREVFVLRDIEELSVNESAESLGITIASVKVRLHRARMMLQKRLAPVLKLEARRPQPKSSGKPETTKRRWLPWS